jgi:hypothetical protein
MLSQFMSVLGAIQKSSAVSKSGAVKYGIDESLHGDFSD